MRSGVSRLTVSAVVSTCGGARRSSDHTDEPASCASRSHSAQSTALRAAPEGSRSEEHTSELQSLMHISYAVFCLKKTKHKLKKSTHTCCAHTNHATN